MVKVLLGLFAVISTAGVETMESLRASLVNEAVLIALALYWSRPVHGRYLASLARSLLASSTPLKPPENHADQDDDVMLA